MPLTNKFLRYTPEITLEIFTLIWEKLIDLGFRPTHENTSKEFGYFKDEHNYLIIGSNVFNIYTPNCIVSEKEITVQEILGYDPFLVKEVIPEYAEIKSGREAANYNHWLGAKDKVNYHYKRKYKVLKVVDSNSEYSDTLCYLLVDPDGNYANFKTEACNISSREVYELQNKPKQPLKQAVHCKTQEEMNYVRSKFNHEKSSNQFEYYGEVGYYLNTKGFDKIEDVKRNKNYQILSFQEWCDLNGYKMEKEMILDESHIGKLVSLTYNNRFYDEVLITKEYGIGIYLLNNVRSNNDGHPNKSVYKYSLFFNDFQEANLFVKDIKFLDKSVKKQSNQEFKVGDWVCANGENHTANNNSFPKDIPFKILEVDKAPFEEYGYYYIRVDKNSNPDYLGNCTNDNSIRHATPEEINQHLISIGQIPAGEPLNTGIEPNKDGMFRYTTYAGTTHVGKTSTISGQLKMILSIDDKELPMVNIIKTNPIKQLLNND